MWKAAKGILSSKKAMMAILSGAVWLIGKAGFDLDVDEIAGAVAPLWMYIFAQGVADHGKGKAELESSSDRAPTSKPE